MKTFIYTGILSTIFLFASCNKGGMFCYKENGETKSEKRELTGFSKIALESIGNVHFTQSTNYSVEVEASSNLLEILKTEVKGNTLEISTKKNKCISGNPTVNYYISAPELSAIDISGSGNIYIPSHLQSSNFDVNISGSGNIYVDSLSSSNLSVNISGSGNINVSGSSVLDSQKIKISGSGDINNYGIKSNTCDVNISGSGTAYIYVLQTLKVNISGSGNVIYKGSPSVDTDISGSGDVHPF